MKKIIIIIIIISSALFFSSCATSEKYGCAGNRGMLTAGAGKTKFNK